jgi:hypothetical protein
VVEVLDWSQMQFETFPIIPETNMRVFYDMLGRKFINVSQQIDLPANNDILKFNAADGEMFIFKHTQDCCESVGIEDITGDLADLIGSPLLLAQEVVSRSNAGSTTWTFYTFATIKGTVTVRWYGQSNGYYSESVDYHHVKSNGAHIT